MTVSAKNPTGSFLVGVVLCVFGFWLIFSLGYENEFLPVLGKVIGVICIVIGFREIIYSFKMLQDANYLIEIENDYLVFDKKKIPLEGRKITLEFKKRAPLIRVTLRVEENNKSEVVFKNLVFNDEELNELLDLIRPYLKHEEIVEEIKKENITLRLLEKGFALNNREFLFHEIEDIQTTLVDVNGTYYLDFKIVLKNGEIIDERLIGGSDEYAKAIYLRLKHRGVATIECDDEKKRGIYFILAMDVGTAILIYIEEKFWILGGVMFFITAFYLDYFTDSNYENKLCKKVSNLFETEVKNKRTDTVPKS